MQAYCKAHLSDIFLTLPFDLILEYMSLRLIYS